MKGAKCFAASSCPHESTIDHGGCQLFVLKILRRIVVYVRHYTQFCLHFAVCGFLEGTPENPDFLSKPSGNTSGNTGQNISLSVYIYAFSKPFTLYIARGSSGERDDTHIQMSCARPVKFTKVNSLPCSEDELPSFDHDLH